MANVLTVKGIEKAPPRAARYELPDTLIVGLRLVVQPSGARSFVVRYRTRNREQRKLTLGPYLETRDVPLPKGTQPAPGMAMTLAEARQAARVALAAVAEGRDPSRHKKASKALAASGEGARDTFGAVARLFITRYARPKNRTWIETARHLGLKPDRTDADKLVTIKGGLVDRWGDRNLADIRKRDIVDELDGFVDRGAPIEANRWLAAVRKMFSWSMARDLTEVSPCTGVAKPGTESSRERTLTDAELRLLWFACDRLAYPIGPLVKMLALTGSRRAEVAAMTWSEILDEAVWSLSSLRTKNRRPHIVPLSSAALEVIAGVPRIAGQDFLFSYDGRSHVRGYGGIKQKLDAAMAEIAAEQGGVEIVHFVLHDLRRTAATRMADLGVAPHIVEAALNHISGARAGVAGTYNRAVYAEEKRAALERWAKRLEEIVSGTVASGNVVELDRARA